MLAVFAAQACLQFGGRYLLEWTGERVVNDLQIRVYAHLHRLSHRCFSAERIGDLGSRLTNDVAFIQAAATGAFAELVSTALRLVGSAALLVAINWRLGALILLAVPGAYLVSRQCARAMRGLARRTQDRLADATAVAQETLIGMRAVLAFARGPYEVGRYQAMVERLFEAQRSRALVGAAFGSVVALLLFSTIVSRPSSGSAAARCWAGGSPWATSSPPCSTRSRSRRASP
jgi:subfamily B ATP-binding cassette protein MsbA